jgi:hypothetical protein
MEGFIQQGFIQEFPHGVSIEKVLDDGMKYLTMEIPRVTNWLEIWFTPNRKYIDHQIFILTEGPSAFFGFIVSQEATFLDDSISAIIQLYGKVNVTDDTVTLTSIKHSIHDFIIVFIDLCSLRLALNMWLIINPYTFPWFILITATEWFTESLSGIFPAFFGIEVSGTLLLTILANIADYIKNLVFTMPYLPSERIPTTIGTHEVYTFIGLPKLWTLYDIPNNLREQWYHDRPDILWNFKNYYEDVIDFLPLRILEEFYNRDLALNHIHHLVNDLFHLL